MTILLVDGPNILARSAFAAKASRAEMSVDGVSTSALVIFINTIAKYVRQVNPTSMAVFWDMGHQARDEIDPSYKANRTKHVEAPEEAETPWRQTREFLTWAGVGHLAWKGYEADDLIAMCARANSSSETPEPCAILSGDKDMLQLVDEHTFMIRPGSKGSETWDVDRVRTELELTPEQIPLYMALVGDTSDNIKGVPGVGPKKALKALAEAGWSWDTLLEQLGPEKAAMAVTARRLVDLRNNEFVAWRDNFIKPYVPPFMPTAPGGIAWDPLARFLDRWQMNSVLSRLNDGSLWYQGTEDLPPETDASVLDGMNF